MKVILSTRNPRKVEQAQAVFLGSKIFLWSLDEAGIRGEGAEQKNSTIENNARIKALYAYRHRSGFWCVADDTGLFIPALGGEPGADAAIWGGEKYPTEITTNHCLLRMKGIKDRRAIFRTVIAAISPTGEEHSFEGTLNGILLEAYRVPPKPRLPYDSLFVPKDGHLSLGEMSLKDNIRISHRGKAFRALRTFLESRL